MHGTAQQSRLPIWSRVAQSGVSPIFSRIRLWLRLRETRNALAELGDDLLRDIGVTREEARQESSAPFWRTKS